MPWRPRPLREMFRQVGPVRFDENGMLQSGMVVRHLVLPGAHKDSLRLLNWLAWIISLRRISG